MKRFTFCVALMLLSLMAIRAEETITVSATNSDVSQGLDLKAVAKLFARAANLEEFEAVLNNPDSAFTNLDLNGDGDIDYIRVVETGSASQHLIVLQAILAKDIYQDVASILVVKDEADNVKVQIVGDEYIYGANYIIEPVYIYRPVIYDWFWGPGWVCWTSPFYWGYYPPYWYVRPCWEYHRYWSHCYAFHHCYPCCSYRYAKAPAAPYRVMREQSGISRRDYAVRHPESSFSVRQASYTNARDIQSTRVSTRQPSTAATASTRQPSSTGTTAPTRQATTSARQTSRTFGSANVASTRTPSAISTTTRTPAAAATRSSAASTASTRSYSSSSSSTPTRSSSSYSAPTRSASSYTPSSYSSSARSASSSYSSGASSRGFSGGGYSGGGYSGGGGFSGGGSTRSGGGSSRR